MALAVVPRWGGDFTAPVTRGVAPGWDVTPLRGLRKPLLLTTFQISSIYTEYTRLDFFCRTLIKVNYRSCKCHYPLLPFRLHTCANGFNPAKVGLTHQIYCFIQVLRGCLEGTTASQRRSVTGYEVPGITGRDVAAWKAVPCQKERCISQGSAFQARIGEDMFIRQHLLRRCSRLLR